jgi:uncharacterized protein (TIGR03546 family)
MILFVKLIRKIGKMLRGGAGKKEIFLGAFLGVLIGFNPTMSLTLILAILVTLLLNANVGFTLLGVALGKVLGLSLSVVTFHTGYAMIHNLGMEGIFSTLSNAPVTALMDLNVYSMIGSLPYAIVVGLLFAKFMAGAVTKIREQMVKLGEHEHLGKVSGNKVANFLMWLAFGKQKISTADVLAKNSPLLRKSGLILVGVVAIIALLLQFLLLDVTLKKGLQSAISAQTGAEVNIGAARFSPAGGKLELSDLQVTDPDKPTHNAIQIKRLVADLSISDLLRRTYSVDLLAGSVLAFDVERETPGKLFPQAKTAAEAEQEAEKNADEAGEGNTLDDYVTKAEKWKAYGEKLQRYLQKSGGDDADTSAEEEKPMLTKEDALANAQRVGYLKAAADLVSKRATWTVHRIEIDGVELGSGFPLQTLVGSELSSHPTLNALPTSLALMPEGGTEPMAKITLHFEDPAAQHDVAVNLKDLDFTNAVKTGSKLTIEQGLVDVSATGTFSKKTLELPFSLTVRDLKTNNELMNNLKTFQVPGKLYGSLSSPRVKLVFNDNLKAAAVAAVKEKAKKEIKKAAEKELNKVLGSGEANDLKKKAAESLKKFF